MAWSAIDALYLREGDDADPGAAANGQLNDQPLVMSHLDAPRIRGRQAIAKRRVLQVSRVRWLRAETLGTNQ